MRRPQSPRPLRKWSHVYGTVYNIRCERAKRRWWRRSTSIGYVGMTVRKLRERVREHLYGGGSHDAVAKPWADLVPGYDPSARTARAQFAVIDRMIADGTVFASYRGECWHWYLKLRESLRIMRVGPPFNIQENMGNPRHVPKWKQEQQRAARDAQRAVWNAKATGIRRLPDGRIERYGPGWPRVEAANPAKRAS